MSFIRDGRVFIWKKGEKDANGERLTKSAWVELYYGAITVSENMIVTEQKPEILNHPLQSQMELKPAFNCDRSYIYRYKDNSGENEIEITRAIRFKKPEIAQEFKKTFEEVIAAMREAEKAAQSQMEDAQVEEPVAQEEQKVEEPVAEVEQQQQQQEEQKVEEPVAEEQVQEPAQEQAQEQQV